MKSHKKSMTRRDFFRAAGVAGLGTVLLPRMAWGQDPAPATGATPAAAGTAAAVAAAMLRRKFGKTGVEVPILSMGGMYDIPNNQHMLRQAIDLGITYWDTAAGYSNGQSEVGIGMFFEKNPDERKNIFLVSKASGGPTPDAMTRLLNQSLERMKTDHVDLYFMHGMSGIAQVDKPEIKAWAENAKKEGKIKLFGFSTHSNMEQCLMGASKLGWIDGMMITYSYRNMNTPEMKAAIDACVAAGIGLTAMKTQGKGPADDTSLGTFTQKGFTPGQAKLKAVWENPQISAICSQMPNVKLLKENAAAAMDKTQLAVADRAALARHAEDSCAGFCAGCRHLCEGAIAAAAPVQDVMRYLMYHRHYGMQGEARAMFTSLPADVRDRLAALDYSAAERACPHRLPIASLMREASSLLA
jgi:predicted aldo/keto reductase-like oxidoreductase